MSSRSYSAALVGGVLSLATLPLHIALPHELSVDLAAVVLAIIGAIYVGFAFQRGNLRQILGEVVVASLFAAAALAVMWGWIWLAPVAYAAHAVWDMLHHERSALVAVPTWYPPFCAVYDLSFAIGLSVIWLWPV